MDEENKTPEEIIKDLNAKLAEYKKMIESKADSKAIDDLKSEIDALKQKHQDATYKALEDKIAAQEEILKTQGTALAQMQQGGLTSKEDATDMASAIVKAIRDNHEAIKAEAKKKGMVEIELKTAGTMTITGNYTGGTRGLSTLEPGVTRVVRRSPFLRQIMNVANTTSPIVTWVEQLNPDPGVAGMTAEGADKTQTDFDLIERSQNAKKITAYIKVSMEMLEDLDFIEGEIRNELMELIELKFDEQLLSGDDTNDNLKGILESAQPFTGLSLAGTVSEPNNFDVIRAAVAQIAVNGKGRFIPSYVLANPIDAAAMDLTKASDGHYVMPPFTTVDGKRISGLTVIENTGIDAGDYLVGDFTKANLRIRKDMTIQAGRDGNDFTKNLMTILAELRAVAYVKTNHVQAFVTGTFADDIATLNKTP